MLNEDAYRLLNIAPDADDKTIRKAYRERSKELHPDVNPSVDAAAQFAKLNEAVNILLDPIQRLKHDDKFGHNKHIRNQDKNAKQKFSDYQKSKAEHLVREWSNDYEKAMEMREKQRSEIIKAHKRKQRLVVILLLTVIVALAVIYWFASHTLDQLPNQK